MVTESGVKANETPGAKIDIEMAYFKRKSSGLNRVMSPYSAFIYNILNIAPIFPWVYLLSAGAFPGANIWLGILITGAFATFLAVSYSGIASVMPRTGGDYVFQSRVLGPLIGFPVVATMILFWFLQWDAIAGWLVSVIGISPLFVGLGVSFHSVALISLGQWFLSSLGIWITTIVVGAIATITLIKGLQWFVKLQYVMWYSFLLAFALIVILFLVTPHLAFVASYNRITSMISPSSPSNYYSYVMNYEASQGFHYINKFSFVATLGVLPIALTSLGWVGYAQEQAGEIKQANSFKKQLFINLGGGVTATLMMALLAFSLTRAVGAAWLGAAAYGSYVTSNIAMPIAPWFSSLVVTMTSNPVLIAIIAFGIFMASLQIVYNVYIGQTRVAIAASIDRILPAWVSKINKKTGTPLNIQVAFFILGTVIYSYVYNFIPMWTHYALAVTAVSTIMYMGTAISAALMPRRLKESYASSEVSKYKFLGIPLVSFAGIIAALFSVWMLFYYVTVPSLGVASNPSYMLMVGIFIGWLLYYIVRRYQLLRKEGVDLNMNFKYIPPT
ncbi:MAG: amino acid permease [Thermoplasmatales archaeon]